MSGQPWVRGAAVAGGLGTTLVIASTLFLRPAPWQAVAWLLVLVVPLYGVGVLAYRLRPDLPMSRLLLLAGSAVALFSGVVHAAYDLWPHLGPEWRPLVALTCLLLGSAAQLTVVALFLLFPHGRVSRDWERVALGAVCAAAGVGTLLQIVTDPWLAVDVEFARERVANPVPTLGVGGAPALVQTAIGFDVALVVALAALVVRYRHSDGRTRAQIRWLFLIPLVICALLLSAALLDWAGVGSAALWAVGQYVVLATIPVVLLVSIVRHRLLDVDVVIRRTLVYGVLWALIAVAYTLAATAVGFAGSQRLPVVLAVALTVVVTAAFHPLRRRVERAADRWVFGRRLGGHELLEQLGRELESVGGPDALVERIAATVQVGLRAEWVEIRLEGATHEPEEPVARAGRPRRGDEQPMLAALLSLGDEQLGAIMCGPRTDGRSSLDDERVLQTLARQAALAVHNERLSHQLADQVHRIQRQAAELEASRARIVTAEDAERRRIERDLHDGAQQQVVAMLTELRLVQNQLQRDPAAAAASLHDLERSAQALHSDLAELTRGIHPAVLTDQGLVEAIRSRTEYLPLQVDLELSSGPWPRLADAVEGAAYFVCSEALTNVLKHAGPTAADVSLGVHQNRLLVEIRDRGRGFNGARGRGRGLANMADRVEALGGALEVTSEPGRGTLVRFSLPVAVGTKRDD